MIADLLPLIVAAAALPIWVIITLLLLRGEGGVKKAAAFAGGAVAARSLVIVLFTVVFGSAADQSDAGGSGRIASTLLTVLGIALLIAAFKKWRKEEDPDAPPPKWMAMLDGLSPLKAFGIGALFMLVAVKQWVFTLSAIATVEAAQLSATEAAFTYVIFVLGTMSLVLLPIIASAVAPRQSAQVLEKAMGWLERNNRVITIAVSLIFGVWFLIQGVTGLLG